MKVRLYDLVARGDLWLVFWRRPWGEELVQVEGDLAGVRGYFRRMAVGGCECELRWVGGWRAACVAPRWHWRKESKE